MVNVMAILLLILALFMAIQIFYNKAPQETAFLVLRRLGIFVKPVYPVVSPYHRNAKSPEGVEPQGMHNPILINLKTSEGSGQATHPDVLYMKDGFGAGKWPYWMAVTPYPNTNHRHENPEIFVSYDGVFWEVPAGLHNPVASAPSQGKDHLSDTDLLHYDGHLWLFYRETKNSTKPIQNRIFLKQSTDGVNWSEPIEVLKGDGEGALMSPAVLHDDRQFVMWSVEGNKLVRRFSSNGTTWGELVECEVAGLPGHRTPWHIDVFRDGEMLRALITSSRGPGGKEARIHYAFSRDGGMSWTVRDFLIPQTYGFESKLQYRGTIVAAPDIPDTYYMWYSAMGEHQLWHIAYLPLRAAGDDLLPMLGSRADLVGKQHMRGHYEQRSL